MTWYTGDSTYDTLLAAALAFAAFVALASIFIPSPYGRFASKKYGVSLNPRLGWFLMELPATVAFLFFFFTGPEATQTVPLIFCAIWLIHYANRGWIFPFLIRAPQGQRASFSLMVVGTGWLVTTVHAYLNGRYFSEHGGYTTAWLSDPRFLIGVVIYYVSYGLNIQSDAIIRTLRSKDEVASGEKIYRIPRGGLFRYVTNPSYLTELTAWAGFALFTWSLAGVFIFAISAANLIPRAFATHAWYREKFDDYPTDRKVLIPYVL